MIIFIDNEPNEVLDTRIQFFRMGIHSLVCRTDELENLLLLTAQAVLIMRPECIPDIESVCKQIRRYVPKLPLAIMYRPPLGNYYAYLQWGDVVFDDHITTLTFANTVFDLYEEKNGRSARDLMYCGIRARVGARSICVLGQRMPVCHEEVMLTRYLLLHAPRVVPVGELAKTCFRPTRTPKDRTVHTHFRHMNELITRGFGRPAFLYHKDYGYMIAPI